MPDNPTVDYRAIARAMAQKYGVDPDIFERQIEAESNFDPNAESPAGALGIAQIMPDYHPGVDTSDPIASLDYAAQLMASHLEQYGGDYRKALAAYNAGPGAVDDGSAFSIPETTDYIDKIMGGPQYDAANAADPNDPRNDPANRRPGFAGTRSTPGGPPVGMTAADLRAAQIREINARTDLSNAQKQELLDRISGPNSAGAIEKQRADATAGTNATQAAIAANRLKLDEATQKWKEGIDARDTTQAQFWKARSQELQQNDLALRTQTAIGENQSRQNTTALDYTKLLAGMKGPQDWVQYWKLSHGESPVPGQEGKSLEDALPPWARGTPNTAFTGSDVPPWAAGVLPGTYQAPGASNDGGVPNGANTGAAGQQAGAAGAARGAAPITATTPSAAVPAWAQGQPHPMYDAAQVAAMTPKQAPTSTPGSIWSVGGAEGTFKPGTGYGAGGQSFTGTAAQGMANPNPGQPFFTDAAQSEAWSKAHPAPPPGGRAMLLDAERDANGPGKNGVDMPMWAR